MTELSTAPAIPYEGSAEKPLTRELTLEDRPATPRKLAANSKRDLLRQGTSNSTSLNRKALLLKLINDQGGIVVFTQEFMLEYDKLLASENGIVQTTDRSTVRRALLDLVDGDDLHWIARAFPNHTGRTSIRRDFFFLREIEPGSSRISEFIEEARFREASRKQAALPHKVLQIVARPEMDMIPTVAQRVRSKRTIEPLKLSKEDLAKLRVRLSEKASKDSPSSKDSWFSDGRRIQNVMKPVKYSQQSISGNTSRSVPDSPQELITDRNTDNLRPNLRKILPKRISTQFRLSVEGRQQTGSGHFPADNAERFDQEVALSETKVSSTSLHRGIARVRTRSSARPPNEGSDLPAPKKIISKRADRFDKEDIQAHPEDLTAEHPAARRRKGRFTDVEDDTIVRAANLSMLFFSRSDLQSIVDWPMTARTLPEKDEIDIKRRYASIRNRFKHKVIQNFLMSSTFVQLYNEAVHRGNLEPAPRKSAHGALEFDLIPLIRFSRRFNPEQRLAFSNPLPVDIAALHEGYSLIEEDKRYAFNWTDEVFNAPSSTIKKNVLASHAFVDVKVTETKSNTTADQIKSSIKALLMTAEEDYSVKAGQAYLAGFACAADSEAMLKTMIEDNLVVGTKGDTHRLLPGRNFQLSDRFFSRFRPLISTSTMKSASAFENLLTESFSRGKTVLYPPLANNGASVATLESTVRGRLKLEHGHKGWAEHGLIHDYAVRSIDSRALDFDIILVSEHQVRQAEVVNTPMKVMTHVPSFWVDINGKFMETVYRKTLALVLGFVVLRGHTTFAELLRLASPVLLGHELHICMEDLVCRGFVKSQDDAFEATDRYYRAFD